jgi:hypothetical protein
MAKLIPIMACALLLTGCPEETTEQPDAGATCAGEIQLDWGHRDEQSGWVDFADQDKAEITLGFQGFRYIESTVRLRGTAAEFAIVAFRIEVEGHPASSQRARMALEAGPDGDRYADVLVFFNDIPLPQFIGRSTTISVHALAEECAALNATDVTVVDEERCIQAENGEVECSET